MLQISLRKGVLVVAGIVTAVAGILILVLPNGPQTEFKKTTPITYSTTAPDETPPSNFVWQGRAADPKRIIIPTLGIDGFIQQVGVDQNKQVAVPSNIHMAGWFVDTVRPGEPGLSVIDGHVDGRSQPGIFEQLATLQVEDKFSIERGDGRILRYQVMNVSTVDTAQAASPLFSQDPSVTSQVNLITCGGTFDTTANGYEKRVIVTARLL